MLKEVFFYMTNDIIYIIKEHFDEAVFGTCVYILRTGTWCYSKSVKDLMDCSDKRRHMITENLEA